MINSLLKDTKIDAVMNTQAAGTDDTLNGDILDMQGFDGVCFICKTGDVTDTSVITLKSYEGDESDVSDGAYNTVAATVTADATSGDDKLLILDVKGFTQRYVRADVVRATANAVIEAVIAVRYNARTLPTTQGTDVVDSDLDANK